MAHSRSDSATYVGLVMRPVDPVCGRQVDPESSVATHGASGTAYHFCSTTCRDQFLAAGREHELDRRGAAVAIWLLRLTRGRLVGWLERLPFRWWSTHVHVLLLTTRGRRSGLERTVVLQFFPDGDRMLVLAADAGLPAPPNWYRNLMVDDRAQVEVAGRTLRVRPEELPPDEAAAFWPRVLEMSPDVARYSTRTIRMIPIVRLVPQGEPAGGRT
jgi:F420H(2)-dependent quinone reductase